MSKTEFITAQEAALLIKNGDTVGSMGFVCAGHAEEISQAVEARFLNTGTPNNLTMVIAASHSNPSINCGLNRWCKEGLIKKIIGGHFNLQKDIHKLILENKIATYNFPQGVMVQLYRAIAGKKPGLITSIGLNTFVDPRIEGGRMNQAATEDLVEVMEIDGQEYMRYKPFKLDVAIIRGTYADEAGNISWEKEGIKLEQLVLAQAAKACGGIVIAQVESVTQKGSIDPKAVLVPGISVDYVVVAKPENHMQSYEASFEPWLSGQTKMPLSAIPALPLNERKVMARRAALELLPDAVINLGIGVPEWVGAVAAEEGILNYLVSTVEPGVIGGMPLGGLRFGCSINPEAFIDHPAQFDFYDGGGLDLAVLGMAEVDRHGNINVSRFGPRVPGAGGFINISQSAKKVVFTGSLTASGFECQVGDGRIFIQKEGKVKKFINQVGQITFSGEFARKRNLNVLFVTERAVFRIEKDGLTLIEIAPGIDLEKDVLANMAFTPIIAKDLKLMDERIFHDKPMGIREEILSKTI